MIALLALTACGNGMGHGLGAPSCESADDWVWQESPIRMVLASDKDGVFEVDPGWSYLSLISGSWNDKTGDYLQQNEEDGTPWVDNKLVATLDVLDGGDYRLDGTWYFTDVNGSEVSADVQTARVGCHDSSTVDYGDAVSLDTQDFDAGVVTYTHANILTDASEYYEGSYSDDGTSEASGSYVADGYVLDFTRSGRWEDEHYVLDGTGETLDYTFGEQTEDWRSGIHRLDFSGTYKDGSGSWTIEYVQDYNGNGTGVAHWSDGTTCELVYEYSERYCICGDEPKEEC